VKAAPIETTLQRKLLFEMIRIRMVEETIAERYADQEMRCPVHLSIGQEAIAVGVSAALETSDYVMSTHRGHAHYLAKGGNLIAMLSEIYGKAIGCSSGKGGSMHLVDLDAGMMGTTPIVGSSIPVAVGTAFGAWLQNENRVTAVYFGEGATEEGVFFESLNFAALKQLPVVFVCENNLYSVYSPMEVRQPETRNRVDMARANGLEAYTADGNSVIAVHRLASQAASRARSGQGPTFLEFQTYRWREHCGPNFDNDIGYRTEAEFQEWRKQCPIESFQRTLMSEGIVSEKDIQSAHQSFRKEIDAAFKIAQSAEFPDEGELTSGVYA
jgi:TPP-dependent pyruvate/acetoin dehydrogenase alpha subunit